MTEEEMDIRANLVAKYLFTHTQLTTLECIEVAKIVQGRSEGVPLEVNQRPVFTRDALDVYELCASFIEPKTSDKEMTQEMVEDPVAFDRGKRIGRHNALKWAAEVIREAAAYQKEMSK